MVAALFATARKSFTCQICLKKFYSHDGIQKHFHTVHKDKAKKVGDNEEMMKLLEFQSRLNSQVFPNYVDRSYKCAKCDDKVGFASEAEIKTHLQDVSTI